MPAQPLAIVDAEWSQWKGVLAAGLANDTWVTVMLEDVPLVVELCDGGPGVTVTRWRR
jgi:hypothetical protein